jgi:glycogen operon protein
MSLTELATKEKPPGGFAASPEESDIQAGYPLPIGGTHQEGDGVNFVLFSRHATRVHLELYQHPDDSSPTRIIDLDPICHRTGDIWHIWVRGINAGQLYGYRLEGPYQPEEGHRFNPYKLLLDPYARSIAGVKNWDFSAARGYDSSSRLTDLSISTVDNAGTTTPKCIYTRDHFDWGKDSPPKHSASDTVIYETHVRGFTIHASSKAERPGTFAGLIEKIPYLQDLGATAIELMPVLEFNENESQLLNPMTGEKLKNYWGYNPVAYFAPKQSYSFDGAQWRQTMEFREMVKAFHRAGIEVILDIVLVCCTSKAIFGRRLMPQATNRLCTHSMIPASFRFDRCASQTASGCAWPLLCLVSSCGSESGKYRWAESNCICSIPTIRQTFRLSAA